MRIVAIGEILWDVFPDGERLVGDGVTLGEPGKQLVDCDGPHDPFPFR